MPTGTSIVVRTRPAARSFGSHAASYSLRVRRPGSQGRHPVSAAVRGRARRPGSGGGCDAAVVRMGRSLHRRSGARYASAGRQASVGARPASAGPGGRMVDSGAMSRRAFLLAAALAAAAFCASIAPAVSGDAPALVDRWKSATGVPPGLRKVLVVGIVRDPRTRRTFEDRCVTLLRARGVEAVTSYSIVPDLAAGRDTAEILGELFAQRVEGLITVRLTPLDDTPEEQRSAAWHSAMGGTERPRAYVESALRALDTEAEDFGVEV